MHASIWVLGRAGLPRSSLWPYSALAVVDTLQKKLQMGALSLILMTCPMPNNELGFSSIKVQAQTQRSKSNTTTGVRPSLASGSLGTYGNLYRRRQRYQNQTWQRERASEHALVHPGYCHVYCHVEQDLTARTTVRCGLLCISCCSFPCGKASII